MKDVNKNKIPAEIKRFDFVSYFQGQGKAMPSSLVMYDKENGIVTVDTSASDAYAEFAALHETICCGDCKKFHDKTLPKPGDKTRCREVERVLLTKVIPKRSAEEYVRKRVEMFHALLDNNLNPSLNASFKESLIFLEAWLRNNTGVRHTSVNGDTVGDWLKR